MGGTLCCESQPNGQAGNGVTKKEEEVRVDCRGQVEQAEEANTSKDKSAKQVTYQEGQPTNKARSKVRKGTGFIRPDQIPIHMLTEDQDEDSS